MPLDLITFRQSTSTSGTATTMSAVETGNDKVKAAASHGLSAMVYGLAYGADLLTAEEIAEGDYCAITGPASLGNESAYFNLTAPYTPMKPPKVLIPCEGTETIVANMLQTSGQDNLDLFLFLTMKYARAPGARMAKPGQAFKSVFIRKTAAASADLTANTWGTVNTLTGLKVNKDYAIIAFGCHGEADGTIAGARFTHPDFGNLKPGAGLIRNRWKEGAENYGGIDWFDFGENCGEYPVFNSSTDLTMEAISQAACKPVGWIMLGEL